MTGLFSLTTRKPLAVLLSVLALAGVGSTASAIALAAAAHAQQDLRSPDTRDAAITSAAQVPAARQDLRSPDTRDAATDPRSTTIQVEPITRVVKITSDQFEWGDAAIGAAGALALMLVLASATFAWTRHRHAATGHLTAAS